MWAFLRTETYNNSRSVSGLIPSMWYCDFCKDSKDLDTILYKYVLDSKDKNPSIAGSYWFCDETCFNCYILVTTSR